jgi:hypothetical protein
VTTIDPAVAPRDNRQTTNYGQEVLSAFRSWPVWAVAAVVSIVVTFVTVLTTYDGFLGEAIWTWSALLLFCVNAFFTVVLVVLLTAAFKPQRPWLYAVLVAVGFQAFIATDLAIQPLAGADEIGGDQTLNLGGLYNPVEKALSGGMDDPVEDAKRAEIESLRKTYPDDASLPNLRKRVEDVSATDGSLDATGRKELMTRVDEIIAATGMAATKVRDIALECYARAGRDLVRDVAKQP